MPLAAPPAAVDAAFHQLLLKLPELTAQPQHPEHRAALDRFCSRWLLPAGSDLVPAELPQLAAGPPPGWLPGVARPEVRRWAEHLFHTWGALCRQAALEVAAHPDRHSLLLPPGAEAGRAFVVPGARFREMYYWDTFWSLRGLLVCGLRELAKDIVCILLSTVEQHGFMPNGLRSYYLNRSQPPLLSQMVAAVHAAAPDRALLQRALAALVREHAYWTAAPKQVLLRGPDGRCHALSRYYAAWEEPRPESHREDVAAAEGLDAASARRLWRDLASAAESGWDFSSRWLADGESLGSCCTTRIIPADLNGLLFQMERNISRFAAELDDAELAATFAQHAQRRLGAIDAFLWDAHSGQWRDVWLNDEDAEGAEGGAAAAAKAAAGSSGSDGSGGGRIYARHRQSSVVAASNWVPLYCGCATAGSPQAEAALQALQQSGLLQPAGVAVSLRQTGQQWDWPNCWPPITCMLLEGCAEHCGEVGRQLAAHLAQQYLSAAHAAWAQSGRMWEKLDATRGGAPGGGGEYEVVDGFGWTNGVALLLLERYGCSS
ncbi:hypothetical protein ABPG75_004712 [Micractinium tetrahymenae]